MKIRFRELLSQLSVKNIVKIVAVLIGIAGIALILYKTQGHNKNALIDVCLRYETVTNGGKNKPLSTQRCTLSLEKVDTESAREHGLSDRSSMPVSRGMLFIFDSIGKQCIWMKDMHFNLDIAWLNAQSNVIKLAENLSPASYPAEYCADNTFFVVEVNAGVAKGAGLAVGSHVNL